MKLFEDVHLCKIYVVKFDISGMALCKYKAKLQQVFKSYKNVANTEGTKMLFWYDSSCSNFSSW